MTRDVIIHPFACLTASTHYHYNHAPTAYRAVVDVSCFLDVSRCYPGQALIVRSLVGGAEFSLLFFLNFSRR